jgi:hypothetical protein
VTQLRCLPISFSKTSSFFTSEKYKRCCAPLVAVFGRVSTRNKSISCQFECVCRRSYLIFFIINITKLISFAQQSCDSGCFDHLIIHHNQKSIIYPLPYAMPLSRPELYQNQPTIFHHFRIEVVDRLQLNLVQSSPFHQSQPTTFQIC